MTIDPALIATTQIVTAWLASHEISYASLPELIREVHGSLVYQAGNPPATDRMAPARPRQKVSEGLRPEPAVGIRKSVFADHLVCLEDGKSFKTLARHLNEKHGMTPEQYRARWGLPADYPMMAREYAETRSRISKEMGLGKRR
jgi:predicted transcriptional regulator